MKSAAPPKTFFKRCGTKKENKPQKRHNEKRRVKTK